MSFWKKFAKIAGIAGAGLATALTAGGASPLLAASIGAGSGALSGAANGGVKGALLGGAMGAIPGVGGTAGKVATGGAMSKIAPLLAAGGQMASAAAQSSAKNRGEKLAAQQAQDSINLGRAQENRAERGDAWKQLQHADYLLNRYGQGYTNPQGLPSFGIARTGEISPAMRQGAEGLQAEVLKRLTEGSQLPAAADVAGLTKQSGWEKAANILGPASALIGSMYDRPGQSGNSNVPPMSETPKVGGAIPGNYTPLERMQSVLSSRQTMPLYTDRIMEPNSERPFDPSKVDPAEYARLRSILDPNPFAGLGGR